MFDWITGDYSLAKWIHKAITLVFLWELKYLCLEWYKKKFFNCKSEVVEKDMLQIPSQLYIMKSKNYPNGNTEISLPYYTVAG